MHSWWSRAVRIGASLSCMLLVLPSVAQAHVKWFGKWDILCPPRDPARVSSSPLWQAFVVAAVIAMAALAWLDHRLRDSRALEVRLARIDDRVHPHALTLLRWGLALYWLMAALGLSRYVYLTPELSAPAWVSWAQLACAVLVLRKRTAWISGAGMLAFYAMAIADHGWFHLLDYPLFAGIGLILLLTRTQIPQRALLDLLRWSAAITLICGGIEKFAYPEWSLPMMLDKPYLSLGVSPEAAMYMYGFGEIALSFGLLLLRTGSQVAAALLLVIFVAAVPPFGWVDFVGHSGIIVALALLMLVRPGRPLVLPTSVRNATAHGALFALVLAGFGSAYAGLHALYLEEGATWTTASVQRAAPPAQRTAGTAGTASTASTAGNAGAAKAGS
jgi:uncharacterized membrane protein